MKNYLSRCFFFSLNWDLKNVKCILKGAEGQLLLVKKMTFQIYTPLRVRRFHCRLKQNKKLINDGFWLISVKAEFYQNKFWFSIAYVSKTKDRTKDKARLQKSKRSFLVHFPGESYFYAAGSKLSPHLGEAVSESLYSTGYTIVPLNGMFGKSF